MDLVGLSVLVGLEDAMKRGKNLAHLAQDAMRRRRQEGSYVVIGPDKQERRVISVAVGLSVAQNWASQRIKQEGRFVYKITDVLGTTTYATVTKEEDGAVMTRPTVVA